MPSEKAVRFSRYLDSQRQTNFRGFKYRGRLVHVSIMSMARMGANLKPPIGSNDAKFRNR